MASAFVSYLPSRGTYLLEEEYNNSVQRLYLDPSGILRGGEIWKGRKGLRFDFSAVREVQGISVPMGITLTQVSRPVSITVTYQTIEVNPILADRLFSFPLSPPAENGGC
jgi:outer membrane lipoprotein-sorting protein